MTRAPAKRRASTAFISRSLFASIGLFGISSATHAEDTPPPNPTTEQVRASIQRGLDFLLKNQNRDGSWGGPGNAIYTFTGDVWSNPETHRAWKIGTTGLGCLAVFEIGESPESKAAVDRSLEYLLKSADVRRPSDWDTMNCWAYIYGLQALAALNASPEFADSVRRDRIREVAAHWIKRLAESQSPFGGWGYLEFDAPRTPHLQWATSFTTAAALVALQEARKSGFEVDDGIIQRAIKGIKHCRLPNGAYTYSINTVSGPRGSEWIDTIKGSLGRIQVCHDALLISGQEIPVERLKTGIGHFFREHRFLDIARNRPIPHETYYKNSGYFYFFGHYYAARVIAALPPQDQPALWPKLQREIMKTQQADGSMWDYDMHNYHKPYGVAFGIMALQRSLGANASESAPASASGDAHDESAAR